MKKIFLIIFLFSSLYATPTSLYWTNCTTDVTPTGKVNFDVDNFFTVFRHGGEFFSPDIGLTWGIFSWKDFLVECGVDYLGGVAHPWYFNGKVGLPEGALTPKTPSFSFGFFDVGTHGNTNFNVIDFVIGKTLPSQLGGGRLFAGGFLGSRTFGKNRAGFMVGYQLAFCDAKDCEGNAYKKWNFLADYATGKNFQGGGGVGVAYFFTPTINLITGPVWFSDAHLNGTWKWTMQLNYLINAFSLNRCR